MNKKRNKTYQLDIRIVLFMVVSCVLLLGLYTKVGVQTDTTPEYRWNGSTNAQGSPPLADVTNEIIWYSCQSLANNGLTDDGENYKPSADLSFTNKPDNVTDPMMLTFPAEHYTIEQIHLAVYCTMSGITDVIWTGYLKTLNCDGISDGDVLSANTEQQWSGAVTEENVATATWRLVTFDVDDETSVVENAELWQFKWGVTVANSCTGVYYAAVGVEFGT